MPSTAHFWAVQLTFLESLSTSCQLSVSCYHTSESRHQKCAKTESIHQVPCTPEIYFWLWRIKTQCTLDDQKLPLVTKINLLLCHKYVPTSYDTATKSGFVRGRYLSLSPCIYVSSYTYTSKRVPGWISPQTCIRKGIKLKGCFSKQRELDFSRVSE